MAESLPIDPAVPPEHVDLDAFTLAYLQVHEAECPACGYNVHRLVEPRCPECGRRLALQVVSTVGGYSLPWIISLVTLGLAAGVGLLVLAVTLREGMHERGHFVFVLSYFMANIPLPLVALATRRWFIRMPLCLQYAITALLTCATVGVFGWFIALIGR